MRLRGQYISHCPLQDAVTSLRYRWFTSLSIWVIKPEQTQSSASDTNEDTSKREGIENCIMSQESLKRLARYLIRAAHLPGVSKFLTEFTTVLLSIWI
jgi:hypothetical protein